MSEDQRTARIDIGNERELLYWSRELRISVDELRSAVDEAGPLIEDVKAHLADKSTSGA
jgi:hypothetical protein